VRLSDAHIASIEESRLALEAIPILENGEGPRWKFRYDNWAHDPSPDILLLGAYQHPNTGNNLVGGINLHYLQPKQRDKLAKHLPQIMSAGDNLQARYRAGEFLVPEVFQNYYRTYNATYIRGVQRDTMYPKYGYMKAAKQWLKKKLAGFLKTKKQRQKEAEPKYPQDLEQMQDRLDKVVAQLQQQPPPEEPPDTPEMKAARDAFQQYEREKTLQDIERREDMPLRQAKQDVKQGEELKPEKPEVGPELKRRLERASRETQQELNDPSNRIDMGEEDEDIVDHMEESVSYYSPVAGHYIIEDVRIPRRAARAKS